MPIILRKTITETFLERIKTTPNRVGFVSKKKSAASSWVQTTFLEMFEDCRQISNGLVELGIVPGDRVVIFAATRYEWSLFDMAILGAGAITVPLYPTSSLEDIGHIVGNCGARVIVVENLTLFERLQDARTQQPQSFEQIQKIILLDSAALAATAGRLETLTVARLQELGRAPSRRFENQLQSAKPEDVITICYTSGTTGIPKGVLLTHDNMMSVLESAVDRVGKHVIPERERVLSFLPFSHVIGKVESMSVYVFGFEQFFAEGLERLLVNLSEVRPTILFAVPRIFEKAFNSIQNKIESGPRWKKDLFARAIRIGRKLYEARLDRRSPEWKESAEFFLLDRAVFAVVRRRLGGRLKFAICGGAPLPREIGEFFDIAGIRILEGYGLTETCAPVTLNSYEDPRYGTVGRPFSEVAIRFADDGEILIKSRNVFKGYFGMETENRSVLSEGWFRTGDMGCLDSDGFLHITDRKKDLIITSGGKNIAPQKIENRMKTQCPLIGQFVVHGDRRPYLVALVTLERDLTIQYATENHILFSEYRELVKHPQIRTMVEAAVNRVNQTLAPFETIKDFVIIADEFSIESGDLTPSLKVRRSHIAQKYSHEVDRLYLEHPKSSWVDA